MIHHAEAVVAQPAALRGVQVEQVPCMVVLKKLRRTPGGFFIEEQGFHHSGFATARLAHDAQNFTGVKLEADIVRRHHRATPTANIGLLLGACGLDALGATTAMNFA